MKRKEAVECQGEGDTGMQMRSANVKDSGRTVKGGDGMKVYMDSDGF